MSLSLIGNALFTKTQQRVLGLLYGKPDQRFHTNEIIRLADMGRGTVRRELECLTEADLLSVSHEGNQHYYQANSANPVYSELRGLVCKTFGVADVIKEALRNLDERIKLAFVYGSLAKGEDSKGSDIDLMLVGDGLDYAGVMTLLVPVEKALGRTLHPVLYTPKAFRTKLTSNNSFLQRVMEQPKLMIKGTWHDAGESGRKKAPASGTRR